MEKMNHETLHKYISEHQKNICGIEAAREGITLYSDYWHEFQPTDALHVMSVTKSIVSLLIGLAISQGLIQSIDQPVLDFFPDYTVKRGEKTIQKVTIKHLLTMTAPYKFKSEPWSRICSSEDWTVSTLDFLGGRAGISEEFRYSTLGIHILTGIIAKQSGLTTVEYANRFLFEPIGVAHHETYVAPTAEEHKDFTLSKKPKKNIWFSDPQGVGAAGYGLCLTVKDMLKIGQLCLQKGEMNGKRVVSSEWLNESTRIRVPSIPSFGDMSYGYLWWIPDSKKAAYAALGNSGNVIYIDPEKDITVAVYGTFQPNIYDRLSFIHEFIEPRLY